MRKEKLLGEFNELQEAKHFGETIMEIEVSDGDYELYYLHADVKALWTESISNDMLVVEWDEDLDFFEHLKAIYDLAYEDATN